MRLGKTSSNTKLLRGFCGVESSHLNSNGGRLVIFTAILVVTLVIVLCLSELVTHDNIIPHTCVPMPWIYLASHDEWFDAY